MKLKKMKVKKDVSYCGVISRKIRGSVKPSYAFNDLGIRLFRSLK